MKEKIEIWLPVPSYEGRYSISNLGNIMSMNYRQTGLLQLMIPGKDRYGYLQVCLMKDGKQKTKKIHALVMEAFIGNRQLGMQINHINGIKTDNRPCNLEYCSASENSKHSYKIGLQKPMRGINHPNSKLDNSKIEEIKTRHKSGESQASIARTYEVSPSTISFIVNDKRWSYLN